MTNDREYSASVLDDLRNSNYIPKSLEASCDSNCDCNCDCDGAGCDCDE